MRYLILFFLLLLDLHAAVVRIPVASINETAQTLKVKIDKLDIGMSGFVVHHITPQHSYIVNNVVVESFDANKSEATLKMTPFHMLDNDSVPSATYKAELGDRVELAFGYNRALLIAPNEMIYHRITKSVQTQWIHPDLFATILSYTGHPSPLKSDFSAMSDATSTGLLFIYLDKKIYTLDMKSFKILALSDAPLEQKSVKLPFYTRVQKIESSWWDWGEGTQEMKNYTPYYYKLLMRYNKDNKKLFALYKQFEKGDAK